jgi:nitrogen fixation NifU-like protein
VTIAIDLPSNHQFASAIKEEIREKIESLWDIKKVNIEFTD